MGEQQTTEETLKQMRLMVREAYARALDAQREAAALNDQYRHAVRQFYTVGENPKAALTGDEVELSKRGDAGRNCGRSQSGK